MLHTSGLAPHPKHRSDHWSRSQWVNWLDAEYGKPRFMCMHCSVFVSSKELLVVHQQDLAGVGLHPRSSTKSLGGNPSVVAAALTVPSASAPSSTSQDAIPCEYCIQSFAHPDDYFVHLLQEDGANGHPSTHDIVRQHSTVFHDDADSEEQWEAPPRFSGGNFPPLPKADPPLTRCTGTNSQVSYARHVPFLRTRI